MSSTCWTARDETRIGSRLPRVAFRLNRCPSAYLVAPERSVRGGEMIVRRAEFTLQQDGFTDDVRNHGLAGQAQRITRDCTRLWGLLPSRRGRSILPT